MSIGTSRKEVSFLSNLFPSHLHDFTIFKKLFAGFDFSGFRIHVDLGFVGIQKAVQTNSVHIPHKKPRGFPLSGCNLKLRGAFFWQFIQTTWPLKMLFSGPIGFPSKVYFCQSKGARVVLNYTPLSDKQKAENAALSRLRVVIENAFAKIKSFFILRIENRMKNKQRLDEVMELCAGLANFKTHMYLSYNK